MIQNIGCVFESFVIAFFLLLFNGGRRKKSVNIAGTLIAGALLTANVMITTYGRIFSEYTFLNDYIIMFVYAALILNFRWYRVIAGIVLCNVFLVAASVISMEIVSLVFNVEFSAMLGTNNIYALCAILFSRLIWIVLLALLVYFKKYVRETKLLIGEIAAILIMGVITLVLVTGFALFMQESGDRYAHEFILLMIFVAALDVIICWLLMIVALQKNKALEVICLKKSIEDQSQIYHEILKQDDDMRKQRHNLSNALIALNVLSEQKDYEALDSSLKQVIREFSDIQTVIPDRENTMWMGLLDHKKHVAAEENIEFHVTVECGDYTKAKGIDLCVILGNLLDNAIEAERREPGRRAVIIEAGNDFGILYFCVKNYISTSVLDKNPSLASTKSEGVHGYGIRTVKELVHRYDGELIITEKDHWFCVEILL